MVQSMVDANGIYMIVKDQATLRLQLALNTLSDGSLGGKNKPNQ